MSMWEKQPNLESFTKELASELPKLLSANNISYIHFHIEDEVFFLGDSIVWVGESLDTLIEATASIKALIGTVGGTIHVECDVAKDTRVSVYIDGWDGYVEASSIVL
jgi:hypothetical protein